MSLLLWLVDGICFELDRMLWICRLFLFSDDVNEVKMGGMVLGRESIRSGDPGCDGNELMTAGASETFAAEHTWHTAHTLE
jgi:hypothetical protein